VQDSILGEGGESAQIGAVGNTQRVKEENPHEEQGEVCAVDDHKQNAWLTTQRDAEQRNIARHSTAWHSMAQHRTTPHHTASTA